MKTLSIQQPWASLICSGIKDVENRTWKPTQAPGKILIHASAKKVTKNFLDTQPLDWVIAMQQDQVFGNVPFFEEAPLSAIIGYATVTGFADKTDSLWDGGDGIIKWQLEDMYLFDKPIEGVKGKLGLFDYPLDENSLPPAHKVELRYPTLEKGILAVPVAQAVFDSIAAGAEAFEVDLDDDLVDTLADADGNMLPIKEIRLECGGRTIHADAEEPGFFNHTDPVTNEPIVEKSIFGDDIHWQFFSVLLKNIRPL